MDARNGVFTDPENSSHDMTLELWNFRGFGGSEDRESGGLSFRSGQNLIGSDRVLMLHIMEEGKCLERKSSNGIKDVIRRVMTGNQWKDYY